MAYVEFVSIGKGAAQEVIPRCSVEVAPPEISRDFGGDDRYTMESMVDMAELASGCQAAHVSGRIAGGQNLHLLDLTDLTNGSTEGLSQEG